MRKREGIDNGEVDDEPANRLEYQYIYLCHKYYYRCSFFEFDRKSDPSITILFPQFSRAEFIIRRRSISTSWLRASRRERFL